MADARLASLGEHDTAIARARRQGFMHRARTLLRSRPPSLVRYVLVGGVIGVPASILQLTGILYLYRSAAGHYSHLELNAIWLINFELSLLRNFGLHCAYTWRMRPTWRRLQHAHVAATGAFLIDMLTFNAVVIVTGIVPLAQLFGAGSGFGFNFAYNQRKTFRRYKGEVAARQGAS